MIQKIIACHRVIVGLEHNGGGDCYAWSFHQTANALSDLMDVSFSVLAASGTSVRLSPLSRGRFQVRFITRSKSRRFNLQYICECLMKSKQRVVELALPKRICTFSSNV